MPKDTRFKVGNPGGPGRPLGSRNKLSEYFLYELADHFEQHGKSAIARVCMDSPGEYLRIIAGLIPKELLLEVTQEEKTSWVINASPRLSIEDWQSKHGLDGPGSVAVEGKVTE